MNLKSSRIVPCTCERVTDYNLLHLVVQENAHRQMLEAIRQKEAAELADIPSLANERNEAYEVVREAREAMRTLRAEFKAREDTYYQQERLWRNQTREDRQKQCALSPAPKSRTLSLDSHHHAACSCVIIRFTKCVCMSNCSKS